MKIDISVKGLKKRLTIPIYVFLWLIIASIGFAQGGGTGFIVGLISGILCSFGALLGLVPFVGIPLYFVLANWFNGLLATIVAVPVALAIAFFVFFIIALIINFFISFLAFLVILKLLIGR